MDIADVKAGRDRSSNDAAFMIVGHLVAGIVLYGGIGWLLGRWFGHQPTFIAGGLFVGMAASLYLVHLRLVQAEQRVVITNVSDRVSRSLPANASARERIR